LEEKSDENDISIFYFAGHGGQSQDIEYLSFYDKSISDVELDKKLDNITGTLIIILDSCHSGGFIEELKQPGRIILTACKKNELTYQVHNLSSGIFGYFLNLSLDYFTKKAETTYILTSIFCIYYSNKLSEEFDGEYTIHPQIFDGTIINTKIINRHAYLTKYFSEILSNLVKHNNHRIWKM